MMRNTPEIHPLPRLVAALNAHHDRPGDNGALGEALGGFRGGEGPFPAGALEEVRRGLDDLNPIFDLGDAAAAAPVLNDLLARSSGAPRLSDHDGSRWHLHTDLPAFSWWNWCVASGALGLATALSERGRVAWGRCDAAGCARVYLNTGSGADRRYCSTTCGSRMRVARQRRLRAERESTA
ncbi:CGNR zinc finger domain-containing protein [Mycetocola spongiae]|uniref:CGNR zinc finger domain-containing protein n=1 Tax=Mycetocola spongiae TaxID=2859226 RepID=UPI001CF4D2E3|nr:CGNR zinc finger domain-containing protein [Mycetocola spongiae]UCR89856.1 CGNR zinc finger domain-containing protein [Mycetocola spongiae]